jgi:hypothetical protein
LRKMFLARQVSGTQKKLNQSTPRMANRRRRCRKIILPGAPRRFFSFPTAVPPSEPTRRIECVTRDERTL